MGMFDYLRCEYPLPVDGANALEYRTKDTPAQYLDRYEIREDGTLWHEEYDMEDRSPSAKWRREHPGEPLPGGLVGLYGLGCATRVNERWHQVILTGEIRFGSATLEWSAYFVKGRLNQLHLID